MREQPVDGAIEIAAIRPDDARDIGDDRGRNLESLMHQLGGGSWPCRGTNIDRHTLDRGKFARQRRKNPVHVVRLNPALQKFCRYREAAVLVRRRNEFEAPEPGRENYFPEFRAQPAADSHPRFARASAAARGGRFAKVRWIGNLPAQMRHRSFPSRNWAK